MLFIDDYTRMTWVTFIKNKSEAFDKFKEFKALVENETEMKIKCLRSYNGGEFTSNDFVEFCEAHRIKRQYAATRTSQQNEVVERKNRQVQEFARIKINGVRLSDNFWREVAYITVYILNRGHIRINNDKTPYELWKW
jgi:transposase InsO family protein